MLGIRGWGGGVPQWGALIGQMHAGRGFTTASPLPFLSVPSCRGTASSRAGDSQPSVAVPAFAITMSGAATTDSAVFF